MKIPEKDYIGIHRTMPIVCVDCIISVEDKVLLVKRKLEPMKGRWWFPGGRLHKGEKLDQAVRRIVKDEINIDISNLVLMGHDETQFDTDPFGHDAGTHTVNFVYAARASMLSMMKISLDDFHVAHSEFSFEEIYQSSMHPYIKKFAALSEGVLRK